MTAGKIKKFFSKVSIVGVILMISGTGIILYLLQGYTAAVQVEYKMKAGLKAEPVSSLNTGNDGSIDLQPRKEAESNIDIMEASINGTTSEYITATTDSSLALKTKAKETTTWKGDEIIIEAKEYKFKYTVTEIFTVNPDEIWVLDDVPGETLITLITCEPLYGNKYRLIVRGSIVG